MFKSRAACLVLFAGLTALAALPRLAHADRKGALLVVPVGERPAEIAELADDLLDVLVAEATSRGDVSLLPRENAKTLASYGGPLNLGPCVENSECLRALLTARQLDFFMVALIQKNPDTFLLEWRTIGRSSKLDGVHKAKAGLATADLIRALKQAFSLALVNLARVSEAWFVVETQPSGAEIVLDGRPMGESPLPRVPVVGGVDHMIAATKKGHKTVEQRVSCPPGETCTLKLELSPDVKEDEDDVSRRHLRARILRGVGWGSLIAGAASGVISGVMFMQAKTQDDDLLSKCPTAKNCNLNMTEIQEGMDRRDSRFRLGVATAAGGGVLLVGGTLLLALVDAPDDEASAPRRPWWRSLAVAPAPNGLFVGGRF